MPAAVDALGDDAAGVVHAATGVGTGAAHGLGLARVVHEVALRVARVREDAIGAGQRVLHGGIAGVGARHARVGDAVEDLRGGRVADRGVRGGDDDVLSGGVGRASEGRRRGSAARRDERREAREGKPAHGRRQSKARASVASRNS